MTETNELEKMEDNTTLSPAPKKVKLDLGGGLHPREGFDSVDIVPLPTTKHVVNLLKFPWPFESNSVDELFSSHFIEHIPMLWVSPSGEVRLMADTSDDKEMFFAFFDECHRILKSGGMLEVTCPALQNVRAFQDPTHRRFLPREAFNYLNKANRERMGIGHYNVQCDFRIEVDAIVPRIDGRVPESEARQMAHWWNYVADWRVVFQKK